MSFISAIAIGAIFCLLLALAVHQALWPRQLKMSAPVLNAIAITIHGVAFTIAALLSGNGEAVILFWFTVGPAGALLAFAWWYRGQARRTDRAADLAERLTQERIDRAESPAGDPRRN